MKKDIGDIWDHYIKGIWITITTNIGWRSDNKNPMGAGIAKQAAETYPDLQLWYGERCQKYVADTAVCHYLPGRFVLFPTKALNLEQPHLSWQADSDIDLIRRSAIQLQKLGEILKERDIYSGQIMLPLVGCANGRLKREQVLPILEKYLDDRFTLVER